MRNKGVKRIGPYRVTQTMGSTVSACLSTSLKIKGINFSISSACSTSAHCIGSAWEQIRLGNQDVVIAGGAEDEHWTMSGLFDAMGALSSSYNENPENASRPFDEKRDGFVISGGGGIVIVEELEHALSRNAKIYAEIKGYSATSDGDDMVAPSGEGAKNCMKKSFEMSGLNNIDYINAHGTSTPAGDPIELNAIKSVFEDNLPIVTSTKSLTGHTLGATGVQECIYSILMMNGNFIAGNKNLTNPVPEANGIHITEKSLEGQLTAIFIGLTNCPDICTKTLSNIDLVINNLSERKRKDFKVFFVSIDPDRDSPSVIKNYLETFQNKMFGITGDPKKVFLLSQSWGVLSEKIFNEDGNYLINHSSSVLLLKDGKYLDRINHHAKYKDMFLSLIHI